MNTLSSVQKLTQVASGNIEAFESFAQIMLNASERLVALNLDSARSMCHLAASSAAPLGGNDMRDQFANRMNEQGKTLEQAAAYVRNVNELCIKTQNEVADLNTRRLNEVSQGMQELLDGIAKSGPAGAADIVAAIKSAMSNASTAYQNLIKTTRDVAETNLAAATNALQPIVDAATSGKAARKAA
jgi:phasin protein